MRLSALAVVVTAIAAVQAASAAIEPSIVLDEHSCIRTGDLVTCTNIVDPASASATSIVAEPAKSDPPCTNIGGRIICYNQVDPATLNSNFFPCERVGNANRCPCPRPWLCPAVNGKPVAKAAAAGADVEPLDRDPFCSKVGGKLVCYYKVDPAIDLKYISCDRIRGEVYNCPCTPGSRIKCYHNFEPSAAAASIEPATVKPDVYCTIIGGKRICQRTVEPPITAGAVESTGDVSIKSCKLVRGNLWCLCGRNEWCPASKLEPAANEPVASVESTGDVSIKSCKLVRGNLWCLCGRNEWCPASKLEPAANEPVASVESTGDVSIKSCKLVRGNLWCLC
ncbi:hypothetical protein BGZ95_004900, partial [Linnemannia exigua]